MKDLTLFPLFPSFSLSFFPFLQAYEAQHPDNRNAAIQAAFAAGNYTMAQLAEQFGLHYSSISRIVKMG